ncbi:LysM peptidoglycan-binding domain-containing protein [Parabacteroides sp. Marseille-P3160]|uniref:amino acid ABC transporter substrate-binding protein n=1 Tax=Parabacteroides sp. Marseille-P3160 TaxID=1917887 RepID=UPI0009BBE48F|nr:LysM peptidoglycan-binding domain-containing protein [Parabacteroides sp. Marseille-P3160]
MNLLRINILSFLLCTLAFSGYAQQQMKNSFSTINETGDQIFYHTVERGQTVYSIATMYGVSTEDIYRLNPESRQSIKAGSILKVPQRDASSHPQAASEGYTYHTIQPQETLYRLSIEYNVPATEIIKENPGLSAETFTIGKTIRIPAIQLKTLPTTEKKKVDKELEYTVQAKETLYRICRKFNISSNELIKHNPALKQGLKKGMVLKIPVETEQIVTTTTERPTEHEVNALLNVKKESKQLNIIKVAFLLPFMTEEEVPSSTTARFIEYYEGFLMALDSLRNIGCSVDLSVFDAGKGTKKIQEILKEPALGNADLIIGAVQDNQINMIAKFAEEHQIKYVIPFTSKNDDVLTNPYIFQVNTPHSYLYANAAEAACKLFADDNVIFLKTNHKEQKTEFIKTLKLEMGQKKIRMKELVYHEQGFIADLEKLIDPNRSNILIPTSGDMDILLKIKTPLRMYAESKPQYMLTLFGYPEWQTYTRECLEDFFALNTYIYSNFYADQLSPGVQRFNARFKSSFSKVPINTFPKYGMLGYDTGLYFLGAIHKYGSNFENSLSKIRYKSIQTSFSFERVNNWGGFINTQIFIIHYKPDFTINRIEQ